MKNLLLALALGMSCSACVSTQPINAIEQIVDRPQIGAEAQAELGDTIVEKGRLSFFDGIVLRSETGWGDGFLIKKFTISPGRLRARQRDAKHTYYYSDKMTSSDAILGTYPYASGGVCRSNTDKSYIRGFAVAGVCGFGLRGDPKIEDARIVDVDSPGFRQELIYNGRSGDTVKFLYREFSGDMLRPPFSQDVQYDLKESSEIGFKGVRIEIVDATNTRLTYRVLSTFPDPATS